MARAYSLSEIIKGGRCYFVPVYQRAFSWTERELMQLITDLGDTYQGERPYYMGSLVLSIRKDGKAEVIDGQQRLTAFSILLAVMKNVYHLDAGEINLEYEVRPSSEEEMRNIREGIIRDGSFSRAYRTLDTLVSSIEDKERFFIFLTENVKLLCTEVAENIDLNLYFEVMNRHGAQVMRSDILRSHCLSKLSDPSDRKVFTTIWDACSHFDRYVEEGMSFKLWNRIYYGEAHAPLFDSTEAEWWRMISGYLGAEEEKESFTLSEIISYESVKKGRPEAEDNSARDVHYSLTDFPNFLLLVASSLGYSYPLDDKSMLSSLLSSPLFATAESVRNFAYHLIRQRYLFDRYVVKESEKGSFALLQYLDLHEYRPAFNDSGICERCEDILIGIMNRPPGMGHLDYLVDILSFLDSHPDPEGSVYLEYLEGLKNRF